MAEIETIVEVVDLKKKYTLGKTIVDALKGISFKINKGAFVSLIGESGSGKTTSLDLIGGLGSPTSGSVIIGGEDITKLNDRQLAYFRRKNIGFIFQTFNLIDVYTTYENIEYALHLANVPKAERKNMVYETLEKIGIEKYMNHRPNELSGGQRQRVAIARALVKKPHIVIADEPTANVDSKTGQSILELMRELNETLGSTFIVATHSKQVMQYSKKVIELRDGELINIYENK